MAKGMLQGSRISGNPYFRDEAGADGGPRHLRHANRYAEETLWRDEAHREMTEAREEDGPCSGCGTSNWSCLYEINKGGAHCCPACGVTDSHGIFE